MTLHGVEHGLPAAEYRVRLQERGGIGVARLAKQGMDIVVFDHATCIHHGDGVAQLSHHAQIVCDEDDRGSVSFLDRKSVV